MTAVATIINPLSLVDGHTKEVLVFLNDSNGNLSLLPRELKKKAKDEFEFEAAEVNPNPGLIVNPSSLAVFQYEKQTQVYGVHELTSALTAKPVDSTGHALTDGVAPTKTKCYIKLSPSVAGNPDLQRATADDSFTSLAGVSDSAGENAWLYHLKDGGKKIVEYDLSGTTYTALQITTQLSNTYLAALYDSDYDAHYVIYQNTDKSLAMSRLKPNTTSGVGNTKDSAKSQTPIAACYVKGATPAEGCFVIYYITENYTLTKSVGRWDGNSLVWKDPENMTSAPTVGQFTQLSVVNDGKVNYVIYIASNKKFVAYQDKLS